jgi:hypothetical protein
MAPHEEWKDWSYQELADRREALRLACSGLAGRELKDGDLDSETLLRWPPQLAALQEEYRALNRKLWTLGSRQCSKEVGSFMKELNSGEPLSDEALRWWRNRY